MVLGTLACGVLPVLVVAAEQAGVTVTAIEIRGNKRIELPAIVGRLTLKPGDPYTPENVRGQIKILYDAGYFEDVQVETESGAGGVALVFLVCLVEPDRSDEPDQPSLVALFPPVPPVSPESGIRACSRSFMNNAG